jgi:hypothetical protein
MPRKASKFTKSEIARAVRGVQSLGLEIASVKIEVDGTITVIPGAPIAKVIGEVNTNPWDADNDKAAS